MYCISLFASLNAERAGLIFSGLSNTFLFELNLIHKICPRC